MSAPADSAVRTRRAEAHEAAAIAAVLREAFAGYEALYTPGGFAATTPSAGEIAGRWREGPVWVAVLGGRVVGTVGALPKGEALHVRSMAVLPAGRGRGVGRALLAAVERHAEAEGFARLRLSTTPFLHEAIRLYARCGFARIPDGPHDLHGTPLFTMERVLPPTPRSR